MPVFFNGRLWVSPATMSVVDDSAMYNKNLSVGNLLAIVGKSEGGKPKTPIRLGSAQDAVSLLISGESLKAIEKAFSPSNQTGGPSQVIFVRVDPATQSTLTLKDTSSADVITLLSTDYGLHNNQIRIKLEQGSSGSGYRKLTTKVGNSYFTQDNIRRQAFSLQYTGSETTATLAVNETTATVALGATTPVVIDLTVFATIGQLVDRINLIDPANLAATVLDGNTDKPALNGLDGFAATDIKTAAVTVYGTLQACIDWINSVGEGFVNASRVSGAGPFKIPAILAETYLTGGTTGTSSNSDWQDAFDALKNEDVQWVVPISPSESVHVMTDTHCQFMSNQGRMERRAIVGSDVSTSDVTAISNAKAINSDRTSYVHIGFYDYNAAGVLTLYPPYILAGLLGGMFSGVNPGTSLTNKQITVRGLERKLQNPTQTDVLLEGGVLPVEDTSQGYKVVQSITTWLVNSNYNRREQSVGWACDFVARNVRNALDPLRGAKGNPVLLGQAIAVVNSTLLELARPEPMGPGVIVGDAKNPAYKNITASIDGDVMRVEFQCSPVIPINYIPIVIHAVPWSGTLTL